MDFRVPLASDATAIADVAAASLHASYGHTIAGEPIDDRVEQWYDSDRIADMLDADEYVWLVAEDQDQILGFVQAGLLETESVTGEIHWLHVDPAHRGHGVGRQLLGQMQERLEKRGAKRLRGLVLPANEDGSAFYEAHGFDHVDDRPVTIDGDAYTEHVYEKSLEPTADEAVVETVAGPDQDLVVSFSHGERGTESPFYPAYQTDALDERYGWYCSNCESVDTAMDSMGRIECNQCGNRRKATRWDAAYL